MAIYHLRAKIISRSKGHSSAHAAAYRSGGQSVTHAAAYRAGVCIEDERSGRTFDYSRKHGVEHCEILAPHGVASWVLDRVQLWNRVELAEKRKDAQLAREVEVTLPRELSPEQCVTLVRRFVRDQFVSKGMVADIAIHRPKASDGGEQPHAHIMLTMRRLTPDGEGFGNKAREWNPGFATSNDRRWVGDKTPLLDLRAQWAEYVNRALDEAGSDSRIDHRSHAERGITVEIEPHLRCAHHYAHTHPDAAMRVEAVKRVRVNKRHLERIRPMIEAAARRNLMQYASEHARKMAMQQARMETGPPLSPHHVRRQRYDADKAAWEWLRHGEGPTHER